METNNVFNMALDSDAYVLYNAIDFTEEEN